MPYEQISLIIGAVLGEGGDRRSFVASRDEPSALASLPDGDLLFQLSGSGGHSAECMVSFREQDDASTRYEKLVSELLKAESVWSKMEVAMEHGDVPTDARVALWVPQDVAGEGRKFLLSDARSVHEAIEPPSTSSMVFQFRPEWPDETPYVQIAVPDGPSIIARIPLGAKSLTLQEAPRSGASARGGAPALFPVFNQPAELVAYGALLAEGAFENADTLGRHVMESTLARHAAGESVDAPSVLIAAQWVARGPARFERAGAVQALLRQYPKLSDALALDWILGFDHSEFADMRYDVTDVLSRLRREPPVLTETVRLIAERLNYACMVARHSGAWAEAQDADVQWFNELTDAMYWEFPNTTFRGLHPNAPNADATMDSAEASKKK